MRRVEDWLLNQEVDRRRLIRRCALAAFLLVVSVHADVVFLGASVSNANIHNVTAEPVATPVQMLPERPGRRLLHGSHDTGGSTFQSEPSARFMMRSIWSGQSIYWNPYSATGSLGPETLVDIKTSPLSIAVALMGGSDLAFHLAFLGINFLGVFCLLLLFTVELRLSLLAAIAGAVTYLLNGFNVANLASNISQTWFYFPILVLALVAFAKRPSAWSFVGITAGAVLILASTFLPTTLMVLGAVAVRRACRRSGQRPCDGFPLDDGGIDGVAQRSRPAMRRRACADGAGGALPADRGGAALSEHGRLLRGARIQCGKPVQSDLAVHAQTCI